MEAVAVRGALLEQLGVDQRVEQSSRIGFSEAGQRGGGVRADVPARMQAEQPEQALLVCRELAVSLEEYVVDHVGFPSLEEYRRHVEEHGDGLAVDGTGPREMAPAEARRTLERLRTCAF